MNLCPATEPQLEGIGVINQLLRKTSYWGFVKTPVGRMFLGGNDDGIATRFHHGYLYEPISLALWQERARKASLVVDVGAHTGVYTLAARAVGAKRVISVEPYFLNAARLFLNLRANDYSTEDCVVAAAAAEDNVLSEIYTAAAPPYCTAGARLEQGKRTTAYPTRLLRLDSIVSRDLYSAVTMIKLDVEYALRGALVGATALLETSHPDLLFECFEEGIAELLSPLGYRFWQIDERCGLRPTRTMLSHIETDLFCRNYFASIHPVPTEWLDAIVEPTVTP